MENSKSMKDSPEFLESVEELSKNLTEALFILESTEEGVIEFIVKDDDIIERIQGYVSKLNSIIKLSK